MFNNFQEQFKEQEAKIQDGKGSNKLYFGLGAAKILAINPTEEKLAEIIGPEAAKRFDTQYAKRSASYVEGAMERPVTIWLTDREEKCRPVVTTINLIDKEVISQKGTPQYKTIMVGQDWSIASCTYLKDVEANTVQKGLTSKNETTYDRQILGPARMGEAKYLAFLNAILDFPDQTKFYEALSENGLDFDTVYSGDFSGLHSFVDWINRHDPENNIYPKNPIVLFTVKVKKDGSLQQDVFLSDRTMFTNRYGVTKGQIENIRKQHEDSVDRIARGFTTKHYYIGKFAEYDTSLMDQDAPDIDKEVDDWDF
jgi:hypothetical protein